MADPWQIEQRHIPIRNPIFGQKLAPQRTECWQLQQIGLRPQQVNPSTILFSPFITGWTSLDDYKSGLKANFFETVHKDMNYIRRHRKKIVPIPTSTSGVILTNKVIHVHF